MNHTMKKLIAALLVITLAIGAAQAVQGTAAQAASWKKVNSGSATAKAIIGKYYYNIKNDGFTFSKTPNVKGKYVQIRKGQEDFDGAVYVYGKYLYYTTCVVAEDYPACEKVFVYRIKAGDSTPQKIATVKPDVDAGNGNRPNITMLDQEYLYVQMGGHASTQCFYIIRISTGKVVKKTWGYLQTNICNQKRYALHLGYTSGLTSVVKVYDTKTRKSKKIANNVYAAVIVGKKVYYVPATQGKSMKLMSCSLNGKNKKVLKKIKTNSPLYTLKITTKRWILAVEGEEYTYIYTFATGKLKKKY